MSLEALKDPKPGDYWNEMLNPTLLVVHVDDFYVYSVGPKHLDNGWVWDRAQIEAIPRTEFIERLTYTTDNTKTWAHVGRGALVQEAKEIWETHEPARIVSSAQKGAQKIVYAVLNYLKEEDGYLDYRPRELRKILRMAQDWHQRYGKHEGKDQ